MYKKDSDTDKSPSNIHIFDGIGEADLHAYVDGHLDTARRKEVEYYLRRNPDAAAQIRDYATLNTLLREGFAEELAAIDAQETVPPRFLAALNRPQPRFPVFAARAAAFAFLCLAAAGGGWMAAKHGAAPSENQLQEAALHSVSAPETETAVAPLPDFNPYPVPVPVVPDYVPAIQQPAVQTAPSLPVPSTEYQGGEADIIRPLPDPAGTAHDADAMPPASQSGQTETETLSF